MGRVPCHKEDLVKGAWSPDEDRLLVSYIQKHGDGNWAKLPKAAGLRRCGKSCRLRWVNYLRPDLKRECITEEEADLIIDLHRQLGNKWSKIAARLEGRTDNDIKNYWNCHIKRQLIARGINPETHQPLNTVAAATGPATNSGASGLTNAGQNNEADNNIISRGIHYYNVFLNTKVEITSLEYPAADGEGSSSNARANGIDLNTSEEAHHPQVNLEFSLAPPFQPDDVNNSKVHGEDVKMQEQALCPENDVDVTLGL